MVQGVVVQITIIPGLAGISVIPNAFASCGRCASSNAKPTSTVGSVLSWYSTSASARAEPQSKHQFTGFKPRKT